ncbi:hypothetical protein MMC10_010822 [Thelotrema lepadinum]|nr:hypothetical protein [Thelotrema lepadinum]
MPQYAKWDNPKIEPPVDGEAQKIQDLIKTVNKVQEHNFSHHRHGFRGTHVKTQGLVKGSLMIPPGLPAHLAQGLFAQPKTYPLAIRYANEPSFLQDDKAPGPRGCGMKVFDVPGPFLSPAGESTHTQDFTFNNAPTLELKDLPTCLEIFQIRERNFDDPDNLQAELKKRSDSELQFAPASLPNQHFLSYVMYSQSAYRYGDYIAKFALFPAGELQQQLQSQKITDASSAEQHSLWLREFFSNHTARYDFRVQLCQSLDEQPVEDCSVQWSEEKYPFETVGAVKIPPQEAFDLKRRAFWDDHMKLNVWYGLEAHRPLGSVNRLRKELYEHSVAKREEMNATDVKLVESIDQIP